MAKKKAANTTTTDDDNENNGKPCAPGVEPAADANPTWHMCRERERERESQRKRWFGET